MRQLLPCNFTKELAVYNLGGIIMSNINSSNKLQAKDLINVGIFTAIYFVVYFVVMMIAYIPILTLALGFLCPIFCGIPTMLYFTKVKKFGMITLMGTILGLIMMVMGSGIFVLLFGVVCGLLGDLIMKADHYSSWKSTMLGYGVLSIWTMGYYSRLFFTRDTYLASLAAGYGQEFADTLSAYTPNWMYLVLVISCFIGGLLGALLGRAILKKHFVKAGIV